MYSSKIVEQVTRKPKAMTGALRKIMIVFAVIFIIMGITISQGFMLPGFLLALLYFVYDVLSQREYEYVLEGKKLEIHVILGKRYRRTDHVLDLDNLEVVAPSRHEKVAAYRKGGGIKLPKYDYTSYEEDTPYYTMIITEDRERIKLLLDLSEGMLQAMKKAYPGRVFLE